MATRHAATRIDPATHRTKVEDGITFYSVYHPWSRRWIWVSIPE